MSSLDGWLETASQAAAAGGRILNDIQGKLERVRSKSCENDLVTEADERSEETILGLLRQAFPEHGFLAEESGEHAADSAYVWAIDPLDGTVNYAHNLPFYCVSIGLLENGIPVLGVVHAPALNETYLAVRGQQATLNGRPIQVSSAPLLKQGLLATGFPYQRATLADNNYKEFIHFANLCQDIRRPGAAALDLAYVACGRFEGFWEHHLHPWDVVAGAALITAAGGKVSAYDGGPLDALSGQIVASNGLIHAQMVEALREVRGSEQ
ncbi:MAG: inositol monophosphatase family protein [Candidatus Sericytochromatia bacterium]